MIFGTTVICASLKERIRNIMQQRTGVWKSRTNLLHDCVEQGRLLKSRTRRSCVWKYEVAVIQYL